MERISKILDATGNPIKVKELQEEQTARVGWMTKEFENHPSRGLTPSKVARILGAAEQGDLVDQADLAEDMEEKDAHIFSELSKRKRALLTMDWDIVPPRNETPAEQKAADQVKEFILDMDDFEDHLFDLLDAIGKGYSNLEMEWHMQERYLLPTITHRPARWFTVNEEDRNQLLLRNDTGRGEALRPFGWISHIHKAKSGYVSRSGLHRVLAWPFLFKNYSVRDLAEFLEIYGLPVRLGTYPAGATDDEKATLLRAVTSIGHNAAGIMPEGMAMEFKDAAKGGSGPFKAMIDWCEASESKAILGGTLTSTAESTGLGSGQADVHNEVRHDLTESDAKQVNGTLTRDLIWPLVALNIGGISIDRAPRFRFLTQQPEDLKIRADRDKVIYEMGRKLSDEKFEEVYGEGYEQIESAPPGTPDEAGTAAAKAGVSATELDGFVDQLTDDTQPAIDKMLDQIKTILDEVESLEEFQDRLLEAYSFLDPDELTNVMQLGLSAAELAGRYEVAET